MRTAAQTLEEKGESMNQFAKNTLSDPGGGVAPEAVSFAFWTDLHVPEEGAPFGHSALSECVQWLNARTLLPTHLINGGDIGLGYEDWLYKAPDVGGAGLDPSVVALPVIGNHDAETPIDAPYGTTPPDPHTGIRARYPLYFGGRNYYYVDLGVDGTSVRIMVGHNLTDELNRETGHPCYHNVNPPGADALNPDHSGWTDPESEQRLWLDEVSGGPQQWKVLVTHRPMYANYDGPGRPMHRSGREALQRPIANGLDMVLAGDVHTGVLAGRFNDVGGMVGDMTNGVYAMTLSGGIFVREPNDNLLAPGSVLWSSAGVPRPGLAQMAIFTFIGELATVEIFQAGNNLPGSVVHMQSLIRNEGWPS